MNWIKVEYAGKIPQEKYFLLLIESRGQLRPHIATSDGGFRCYPFKSIEDTIKYWMPLPPFPEEEV
jgi:hypothetical protein